MAMDLARAAVVAGVEERKELSFAIHLTITFGRGFLPAMILLSTG